MLNISNHRGNANRKHNIASRLSEWLLSERQQKTLVRMWSKENPHPSWREWKLGAASMKNCMEGPEKIKLELPHGPAIPLLGACLKKWDQGLKEVSAPLCSLRHYSQQPRHGDNLTAHQWINGYRKCEMDEWRKNTECHSAIKKETLLFVTTRKDLESIMLSEGSQTAKHKYCVFSYMWNLKEPTTQK